jgi:putative ABC transport system ATP-binding protein
MATADLEARDLVVTRDGHRILDGASLLIRPGEIAVVEGPSGSGKSTLLKAMAALVEFDGGTIRLGGVDVLEMPPRQYRTRVAYVAQTPPMLDGTVARNIAAGPALRGVELDATAREALIVRVGLTIDFLARDTKQLSGGERQRVALARALANKPDVLLLDEPTSALDPEMADRICALVRTLATDGLAVAVVTHSSEQAAALNGRRFECVAGRIREAA